MTIKKNENAKELITRTEIENTPFIVITNNETGKSFGTFGKYRITEELDSIEQVRSELTDFTWNKIITVMTLVHEMLKSQSTKTE